MQDRAAVQAKIARRLGRRPHEMLINLPPTVARRDRGTVERLMDLAGRMNPTALARKQPAVLPAHPACVERQVLCLPELQETLPLAERCGEAQMEVSGLTQATKREIMGRTLHPTEKPAQWLQSKVLGDRIEQQGDDIKRVLQFYPEVDSLEVVGASMQEVLNRGSSTRSVNQIERISAMSIHAVSDTTDDEKEDQLAEGSREAQKVPDPNTEPGAEVAIPRAAVKLNGVLFFNTGRRCRVPEVANVLFECHPYQNVVHEVLRVENVGRKVITCQWVMPESRKCAGKCQSLQQENFVMSRSLFCVFPGEEHVSRALFRPRGCVLVKQHLELRIFPNVVGSTRGHIVARLMGRCVPAPEYTGKLRRQQNSVTEKSKQLFAEDLAQHQASLVPLLQPHEVVCPYERVFDEREVFDAENPGYHCERFDDLEALKGLYRGLKKPREPAWDLRLQSVLAVILRLPKASQRRHYFARLVEIQESMKRGGDHAVPVRFSRTEERDRSRFIYVRGCIGNGIQEWEDMMASLELNALKSEVTRFEARQRDLEADEGEDGDSERKPWMRQLRQDNPSLYLLKKLRSRKAYRDSLYMQTYSHLCDLVEDVVSIIESTQYV